MEAHGLAVEGAVELDRHGDHAEADRAGPHRAGHTSKYYHEPLGANTPAKRVSRVRARLQGADTGDLTLSMSSPATETPTPAEILQGLIRFDTSNPPGGERECIEWVGGLLAGTGAEVRVVARDPERPNLIARLRGRGEKPPLLLQGHVDVVPARGNWRHEPFGGELARRLHLGPRRARHEGRRGDDAGGVPCARPLRRRLRPAT